MDIENIKQYEVELQIIGFAKKKVFADSKSNALQIARHDCDLEEDVRNQIVSDFEIIKSSKLDIEEVNAEISKQIEICAKTEVPISKQLGELIGRDLNNLVIAANDKRYEVSKNCFGKFFIQEIDYNSDIILKNRNIVCYKIE